MIRAPTVVILATQLLTWSQELIAGSDYLQEFGRRTVGYDRPHTSESDGLALSLALDPKKPKKPSRYETPAGGQPDFFRKRWTAVLSDSSMKSAGQMENRSTKTLLLSSRGLRSTETSKRARKSPNRGSIFGSERGLTDEAASPPIDNLDLGLCLYNGPERLESTLEKGSGSDQHEHDLALVRSETSISGYPVSTWLELATQQGVPACTHRTQDPDASINFHQTCDPSAFPGVSSGQGTSPQFLGQASGQPHDHHMTEHLLRSLKSILKRGQQLPRHRELLSPDLFLLNRRKNSSNNQISLKALDPPKFDYKLGLIAPDEALSRERILRYKALFDHGLDTIKQKVRKRKGREISFSNISAVQLIPDSGCDVNRPAIIRLSSKTNRNVKFGRVKESLHVLIKWIILDQMAFLYNQKRELTETSHDELFNWLLMEFFGPIGGGLPVMGEVNCPISSYGRNAFGPVQRLIIDYLSMYKQRLAAHQVATNLIGIWYKTFEQEAWQAQFCNDDEFWNFMNQAAQSLLFPNMNTAVSSETKLSDAHTKLGNFQIIQIENEKHRNTLHRGGHSIQGKCYERAERQLFKSNNRVLISDIEKEMMNEVKNLYSDEKNSKFSWKTTFGNIPVALKADLPDEGNIWSERYKIRLVNSDKMLISPTLMKGKLGSFFRRMRYYHGVLLLLSENKGISPESNCHSKLLRWLQSEMFGPQKDPPIFGMVSGNMDQRRFGPIQEYLIEYLCESQSQVKLDEVFCAILGYWYKNGCVGFWDDHFHNDQGFWEFMNLKLI